MDKNSQKQGTHLLTVIGEGLRQCYVHVEHNSWHENETFHINWHRKLAQNEIFQVNKNCSSSINRRIWGRLF